MICPDQIQRSAQPEDLVTKVLQETTPEAITVELVSSPEEEDRWNKLIRKHHYLKEHRLVGESLEMAPQESAAAVRHEIGVSGRRQFQTLRSQGDVGYVCEMVLPIQE